MTDSKEIEKLEGTSLDVAAEKKQQLKALFPEVFTEGGKIDLEMLKLTLGEAVDTGKERYGLNWPGKMDCYRIIQTPSSGTLLPARDESVNFDETENVIIEGDNLEALKLLQKSYLGKIKMIYIDPPYNTGNDFIYPDDYSESLDTYLKYSGQVDDEGRRFSTNTDTDGRFHSKWINMMYPRLFLARNLLSADGLVFISIDENEVDNLRRVCFEIFGEENFVGQYIWKNKYGSGALTKGITPLHEYIVCFSRNPLAALDAPLQADDIEQYKSKDEKFNRRGGFFTQPLATKSKDPRPNLRYPIKWQGKEIWPEKQWVWSRERTEEALKNNDLVINEKDGKFSVRFKQYLKDENGILRRGKPLSLLDGPFTQEGTREVEELLGEGMFDFPKPMGLLRYFFSLRVNNNDDRDFTILDFFAGSGTAAHAVLDLNKQDRGKRKFILVQLPEPTDRKDYPSIADICKERVRRAIKKLGDKETEASNQSQLNLGGAAPAVKHDRGFKVFKLNTSNLRTWNSDLKKDIDELQAELKLHTSHIQQGRKQEDILYEILLKSGFELSAKVEKLKLAGKTVFSVAEGMLLICLEKDLTKEVLKEMAEKRPERVVCLDQGFAGNDQLKTNAVETMRAKKITFRTV